jgi:hypothetical protein
MDQNSRTIKEKLMIVNESGLALDLLLLPSLVLPPLQKHSVKREEKIISKTTPV